MRGDFPREADFARFRPSSGETAGPGRGTGPRAISGGRENADRTAGNVPSSDATAGVHTSAVWTFESRWSCNEDTSLHGDMDSRCPVDRASRRAPRVYSWKNALSGEGRGINCNGRYADRGGKPAGPRCHNGYVRSLSLRLADTGARACYDDTSRGDGQLGKRSWPTGCLTLASGFSKMG